MLRLIRDIFSILDPQEKREFFVLQVLVILMAIMEVIGIAGIGPFIALVSDMNLIQSNATYKMAYEFSGATSPNQFLFMMGCTSLILLALGSLISIITTWRISLFSFRVGTNLGDTLYKYYLHRDWLFHANSSTAELTNKITSEAPRAAHLVVKSFMDINARLVLAVFISAAIIAYRPLIALSGILIFSGCYLLLYKTMRVRLGRYGEDVSNAYSVRYRLINEGLGGVKDILLKGSQDHFIKDFEKSGERLTQSQSTSSVISQAPRYIMELVAFGSIIALILVLFRNSSGNLTQVLPVLSVYALAGFKLLPALQQIYSGLTVIKSSTASFYKIHPEIVLARQYQKQARGGSLEATSQNKLIFQDIHFAYPNSPSKALGGVSLEIPLNQTIGFVGPSGAGKSTMVELILGLLTPNSGEIYLDNTNITQNMQALQKEMAFVPQSIFVSEGTILENIAFGTPKQCIDEKQAWEALRLANLKDLIESLPQGIHTHVGERGVRLSGGQRQRLGIARALYTQSKVLVFDEATSSLDGLTEKEIMQEIESLKGDRAIILIAHRLNTVKNCDQIFLFENGKIVGQGTFNELLEKNQRFNQLSSLG